jgi:hypothetical protein
MKKSKQLWYWDEIVKRYRNPETGRFVGITEMNALRPLFINWQKDRLVGLVNVYEAGSINIRAFEKQVKSILRDTYKDLYAMGAGGRNGMTPKDWGRLGAMLKEQYRYLNPFLDQIARGDLSNAQISARLKMYINSANEALWKAYTRDFPLELPAYPGDGSTACLVNCQCEWEIIQREDGYDCFWRLGAAEHCPDCMVRASEWNPYKIRITGGV